MRFDIRSYDEGKGIAVVEIQGELDLETFPVLRKRFLETCSERLKAVVVDLTQVSYINSYGPAVTVAFCVVAAFMEAMYNPRPQHSRLRIIGVSPPLRKIFDIAMVSSLMEFFDSKAEAIEKV